MSRIISFAAIAIGIAVFTVGAAVADNKATVKVPDGLAFSEFAGYETWQVVSVSQKPGIIETTAEKPTAAKGRRRRSTIGVTIRPASRQAKNAAVAVRV